jgi:hypothetical protein
MNNYNGPLNSTYDGQILYLQWWDIFTLQKIQGYSSLDMVRYYEELLSTDIRNQCQTYSPFDHRDINLPIRSGCLMMPAACLVIVQLSYQSLVAFLQ